MAVETFVCLTFYQMRYGWSQDCLDRRAGFDQGGLVALGTKRLFIVDMIGREGDDSLGCVTDRAVGAFANGMRDCLRLARAGHVWRLYQGSNGRGI
jgi:hypothetical protein